jgi:aerobic carbon-monoxide dehydrogenase medium subunit
VVPAAFSYHRPTSVQEAAALLAELGEDGRALAGGHSLIPMMKLRLASPANLVDLAGIRELKGVRTDSRPRLPWVLSRCSAAPRIGPLCRSELT